MGATNVRSDWVSLCQDRHCTTPRAVLAQVLSCRSPRSRGAHHCSRGAHRRGIGLMSGYLHQDDTARARWADDISVDGDNQRRVSAASASKAKKLQKAWRFVWETVYDEYGGFWALRKIVKKREVVVEKWRWYPTIVSARKSQVARINRTKAQKILEIGATWSYVKTRRTRYLNYTDHKLDGHWTLEKLDTELATSVADYWVWEAAKKPKVDSKQKTNCQDGGYVPDLVAAERARFEREARRARFEREARCVDYEERLGNEEEPHPGVEPGWGC